MDTIMATPALWTPSGTAQRLIGLTAVKSLTFPPNVQGVYLQVRGASVYITLDGTNPVVGGNDLGFEIFVTSLPLLFTGIPGTTIKILQTAATAVVQYQWLTLTGR